MPVKRCSFVLWFAVVVSIGAFSQEVRYFANVDDSMIGGLVGVDPVTKEALANRKGYAFEYSGATLVKVRFLDPFHQYGGSSSFFGCASLEYRWKDKHALEVLYRDEDGNPTRNDSGVFVETEVLDDDQRVIQLFNGNTENRPMLDSYGVCSYTYEYHDYDRWSRRYDSSGRQISDTSKVFVRKIHFNDRLLLATSISYDVDGHPVTSDDGVEGERDFYDGRNNVVREEYFKDEGGRSVDAVDRAGVHATEYTVDAFGNSLFVKTFGLHGEKAGDQDGVFQTQTFYDNTGFVVGQQTQGIDGLPCEVKGVAELRYEYDERKNNVNEKRLSRSGDVVVEYRRKFDQKNRLLVGASFDRFGHPLDQQDDDGAFSYSMVVYSYRDNGDVEERYFNADGDEVGPDPAPRDDSGQKT